MTSNELERPCLEATMNLDVLRTRLWELGAGRVEHSRRTLIDHLTGTARLLEEWGCDLDVCAAGMFHSIYGTDAFTFSCMDRNDRQRLRAIIGWRAEELVFLFSTSPRPVAFLEAVHTGQLVNHLTGQTALASRTVAQALLEIECANLLEQQCGHRFLAKLASACACGSVMLKPQIVRSVQQFLDQVAGPFNYSRHKQGAIMQANAIASPVSTDTELFAQRGYLVIRNLLSRRFMEIATRYYLSYLAVEGYYSANENTRALNRYADALGEAFMPEIQPLIEERIGKTLLPTYSFARIYTPESRLTRHVDRSACEVSATMTVGYKSPTLWPIFLHHGGQDIAVELDVGDALVYRGIELPHWRDPLKSGFWCQLFFHFVDEGGDFIDHRFDGRDRLGPVLPP